MLTLTFGGATPLPAHVLAIGAHADDIEIGCGGTILRLRTELPELDWSWVVLSGDGERGLEAVASASAFIPQADKRRLWTETFRDGFFPYQGDELKQFFESLAASISPDLILTHYRHDLHQDHRLVSELTWNTFRNQLILEYEIPKYDGDLGAPNVFVPLSRDTCGRKIDALTHYFPSQRTRPWFDPELFRALLRLRGMESNAPEGFAEAFYGRKLVI